MSLADLAFFGALSFLGGTLVAGFSLSALWAVFVFCALVLAITFLKGRDWSAALFVAFFFAFGVFYYNFFFDLRELGQKITLGKNVEFSGIVSGEPQPSEKFQKFNIDLLPPMAGEISVLTSPSSEIDYGDVVSAKGEIEQADEKNFAPVSFFPKLEVAEKHRGFWLKEKLLLLKKSVIAEFKKLLPSDSAALLSGLTLGWRGDFTDRFKKEMSLSGTTHLVALSGYNITVLVIAVATVFGLWLSRRATFWVTSLVIFLFVLMVGAEASVIRAAAMGFLALVAKEAGRIFSMRNAIALAAAAMVLFQPDVLFEIGFILSFLSLLGIVYLGPPIKRFFNMENGSESFLSWQENAVTTLSAQLAVAPVLIYVFGNFSLTSIAANVLILELVPLTMLFGFIAAALGWIFYYAAFMVSIFENILLRYELGVIKLFSDWSLPIFSSTHSWFLIAAYYSMLVVIAAAPRKAAKLI